MSIIRARKEASKRLGLALEQKYRRLVLAGNDQIASAARFLAVVLPGLYHQQHDAAISVRQTGLAAPFDFSGLAGWISFPGRGGHLDV